MNKVIDNFNIRRCLDTNAKIIEFLDDEGIHLLINQGVDAFLQKPPKDKSLFYRIRIIRELPDLRKIVYESELSRMYILAQKVRRDDITEKIQNKLVTDIDSELSSLNTNQLTLDDINNLFYNLTTVACTFDVFKRIQPKLAAVADKFLKYHGCKSKDHFLKYLSLFKIVGAQINKKDFLLTVLGGISPQEEFGIKGRTYEEVITQELGKLGLLEDDKVFETFLFAMTRGKLGDPKSYSDSTNI